MNKEFILGLILVSGIAFIMVYSVIMLIELPV
jgi:hypothetical protein